MVRLDKRELKRRQKMTKRNMKKEIKDIIKQYSYKMIPHSWFADKECAIFNAYDECGMCHQFFVDWARKRARRQILTTRTDMEQHDVAFLFFEEV